MKNVCFNPKVLSIQCILHTHCNLRCKFCFETKEKGIRENNNINIDYIRQLPDKILPAISDIITHNNIQHISLYLMGGELFSDDIPDSIFDEYNLFLNDISSKTKKIFNADYKITVISNGVYTKRDRVLNFLKKFNSRIILSYDPCDRFKNDKQKEIWYNTFKYFKENNVPIMTSMLLTKRNIYACINGDDIFEKIGNMISCDSNIYVPRLDYKEYLPNDEDIWNFYKWCLDNEKFNVTDIDSIIKHTTICKQEYYLTFSEYDKNLISNCLEGLPFNKDEYYGSLSKQIIDDTNCLKYKQPLGLQKRGCLICEYYDKCSEMCWTQILFSKYEITECPIKRVYQYLEENPSIVEKYNEWRKEYEKVLV